MHIPRMLPGTSVGALAVFLASTGRAQGQLDDPNLDMGVAIVRNIAGRAQLMLKRPGPGAALPISASPDGIRFDEAFFEAGVPVDVEVDAISIGLDAIRIRIDPTTKKAIIDMGATQWRSLLYTVATSTPTSPARDIIDNESDAANDVFAAVYERSRNQLPAGYWVAPSRPGDPLLRKAVDGGESGLSGTVIAGLDAHVPSYYLDGGVRGLLPVEPRLYFSVTAASATRVPAAWRGGSAAVTGAHLFVRQWDATLGRWGTVAIAASPSDLGLTSPTDDIDGLAVRYDYPGGGGRPTELFFSTDSSAATSVASEVMYIALSGGADVTGTSVVVEDTDGSCVGEGRTIVGRPKASICDHDPGIGLQLPCANPTAWNYVFGSPAPPVFPEPAIVRSLWSGSYRTAGSAGEAVFRTTVNGSIPSSGGAGFSPTVYLQVWSLGTDSLPGMIVSAELVLPVAGKGSASLAIPPFLSAPTPARCAYVWSSWIGYDPAAGLAQSYPTWVRL